MSEIITEPAAAAAETDVLLPEGYADGEDIFASDGAGFDKAAGDGAEDAPALTADGDAPPEPGEENAAESPTTADTAEKPSRLRFTARIDHQDQLVELDESELPALYQKAQATERAQKRLRELSGISAAPAGRDLGAEAEELLTVYPQMQGRSIPTEVVLDSLRGNRSLTAAFAAYTERQHQSELAAIRKEHAAREANRSASRRAPVRSVTAGGGADLRPADPFLAGFESDGW